MQDMKAIDPSHDRLKLKTISRDIYLEQGWKMPRGLMNSEERNPLNFTYIEYLQAKRKGVDPQLIKETIQECWAVSDSRTAFSSVLEERGYYLAKGDKRGHVVVDWLCDVFAVSRMVGLKAKEVTQKLGSPDDLPSVSETTARINKNYSDKLKNHSDDIFKQHAADTETLNRRKQKLTAHHRQERDELKKHHECRRISETTIRSNRLPKGLKALWFRITGKYQTIKKQNEAEALANQERDKGELQGLINKQLVERRVLQTEIRMLRFKHVLSLKRLYRDMARLLRKSPDRHEIRTNQNLPQKQQRSQKRNRGPTLQ